MTANVSIITQKKENVLCVPSIALKYTPTTKGEIKRYETQGIWVLRGSKAVREAVEIGASDDTYTEITSGNIQEDDKIIVSSDGKSSKQDSKNNKKPPMRMF